MGRIQVERITDSFINLVFNFAQPGVHFAAEFLEEFNIQQNAVAFHLHQNRHKRHFNFFEDLGAFSIFHFLLDQRSQSEGHFSIRGGIRCSGFNWHLVHGNLSLAFADQFFNVGHAGIQIVASHVFETQTV
ncbi:MAG: hypothetical protein ACD_34C00650G0001 [uncultured bacterium]|nr:MAG: hypothetical protein ACD_34C00650G0001 [uncultured bacterium]